MGLHRGGGGVFSPVLFTVYLNNLYNLLNTLKQRNIGYKTVI